MVEGGAFQRKNPASIGQGTDATNDAIRLREPDARVAFDLATAERLFDVDFLGALRLDATVLADLPAGGGIAFVASVMAFRSGAMRPWKRSIRPTSKQRRAAVDSAGEKTLWQAFSKRCNGQTMTYYLKLYLSTFAAFLAIDMLWLGIVAREFYKKQLGLLLAPDPNWFVAIIFYAVFVAGLLIFVVLPGLKAGSIRTTLSLAALFGFVTYATYDLTNLATIKNWPLPLTVVDILWGTILSVSVSFFGFTLGKWLGQPI